MIDRVKRFLKVNEDHSSVFSIIYVDVPNICIDWLIKLEELSTTDGGFIDWRTFRLMEGFQLVVRDAHDPLRDFFILA